MPAVRRWQQDAANRVGTISVRLRISNGKIETAVAFDHLRDRRTAYGCLDGCVDVSGSNAVSRSSFAVHA